MPKPVWLCWSSGKDSAWALECLRKDPDVQVTGLLTTVNAVHARVAMHAVRMECLRRQAGAIGLPLHVVEIPDPCPNETYEARMREALDGARREGVRHVAFGDLFLEDVRRYREDMLRGKGIEPLFPLWHRPTAPLAREMVERGLRAWITCVDPKQLDRSVAGWRYDGDFLDRLPPEVDPCGERGEFHTFVVDGPMFREPLNVRPAEIVERNGFVFADLIPE